MTRQPKASEIHPGPACMTAAYRWLALHGELIVALVLFLIIRIPLLGQTGFSQDETIIAHETYTASIRFLADFYEGAFLQHLLLVVWSLRGIFNNEIWLRTLSVLQSAVGLAGLYILMRRYYSRLAACIALLLYVCSPFQVFFSINARYYCLQMTLIILLMYCYLRFLEERRMRHMAASAVLLMLACATHPFTVFIVPAFAVHFTLCACIEMPWQYVRARLRARAAAILVAGAATGAMTAVVFHFRVAILSTINYGGTEWTAQVGWIPSSARAVDAYVSATFLGGMFRHLAVPWGVLGGILCACLLLRLWTRRIPLVELLVGTCLVVPAFVLGHLRSSHFFAVRYLAFWFPAWVIAWGAIGMLVDAIASRHRYTRWVPYAFLALLVADIRPGSVRHLPDLEATNQRAVDWVHARAGTNRVLFISKTDAYGKFEIMPQYYFSVRKYPGDICYDLLTVARQGIAMTPLPPTVAVWLHPMGTIHKPDGFVDARIGFFHLVTRDTIYTNWADIFADTALVMPEINVYRGDCSPEPYIDAGKKQFQMHLLRGWSRDEQWSPELDCVWGTGTDLWVRIPQLGLSNCWVALRLKAYNDTRTRFLHGDETLGEARVGTEWTNILLRVAGGAGRTDILSLLTDHATRPGRVAFKVYDQRELSLLLDWIKCVPVPFFSAATSVYSAAYSVTGVPGSVAAASELQFSATALNGGSMLWRKDGPQPVRMAVLWRTAKGTVAGDHRFWLADDVLPGQSASVACTLTAPAVTGSYILVLGLVHENVAWFGAATPNVELPVTVR